MMHKRKVTQDVTRHGRRLRSSNFVYSGYARAELSFYTEPIYATERLLDVEAFPGGIWDPCVGQGNVLVACEKCGIPAIGSDIRQRGVASQVLDFLEADTALARNIEKRMAVQPSRGICALYAQALVPGKVAILQRTGWLESARRHRSLFNPGYLHRVWQSPVGRISMPPGGRGVPARGAAACPMRAPPASCARDGPSTTTDSTTADRVATPAAGKATSSRPNWRMQVCGAGPRGGHMSEFRK